MDPIKFRCYRCNQLLGVGRHKAGEVVGCPRCLAELVVPQPDESNSTPADPGAPAPLDEPTPFFSTLPTDLATPPQAPSPSIPDIRPEDIRVQPGVASVDRTEIWPTVTASTPFLSPEPPPQAEPALAPTPVEDSEPDSVPPIKVDGKPRKAREQPQISARSRDLILPRSVVASWSLFVLLALGFAFFTGLLAGHYVWRVH